MKTRIIIGFCLLLGFWFFPTSFVFAEDTTSILSHIQEVVKLLHEKVELLQIQVAELRDELATQASPSAVTTSVIATPLSEATSSEPAISAEPLEGTSSAIAVPQVTPEPAAADQELPDSIFPPWMTEGTGTHFEIKNSPFLDITVDSSEIIKLWMESSPGMTTLYLGASFTTTSTRISIRGLEPLTTYYKYEDGYQNSVTIDTNSTGTLTFSQDLSVSHIIFIQKHKGTTFIRDDPTGGRCTRMGIWDATTKTCTLTTDVMETIQILSSGITLDGNGHSITIPGDLGPGRLGGVGVFIASLSIADRVDEVTVKNLNIGQYRSGIKLFRSHNNSLIDNDISSNIEGIGLFESSGNTIDGNNISENQAGLLLRFDDNNNTIFNNTISNNEFGGIIMGDSSGNNITNNVIALNGPIGILSFAGIGEPNVVINNDFLDNRRQVSFFGGGTRPIFDLPPPVGGNHWSDFDTPAEGCNDVNNDGFCDRPHILRRAQGQQDNFPWVRQSGWKIPIAREPVVIVPGIVGTRLNRVSDGEEVWPDVSEMIKFGSDNYLNELKLTAGGNQIAGKEMQPTSIIDKETVALVVTRIFYKNLIDNFKNQGYVEGATLFTAPYDWRLDIRDEVSRLDSVIQQAIVESPNGKIDIIAHSMGGLLVKELLANATSTAFVNKLILAGVPQLGAPGTFKILNFGDNLDFELGPFDILNPERVKIISQNMPGVHELLPSERYVQINGGYVKDFRDGIQILDFDQTEQFMIDNGRNAFLLGEADTFHQGLDQAFNASEIHNIMGCQNPETIFGFNIYDNNVVDVTRDQGDGRVPLTSAINLSGGFTNYFVLHNETNIDHLGLIRDSRPIDLINDIINETGDPLPQGISTSTIDCFDTPAVFGNETTISFSLHSPAQLDIFDSLNNHTGFNEDGDIDLQIPGSSFETINGNSFALVPAGDTYRVATQALSEGDFILKAKTFNGTALINTVTYVDVPLPSNQTQAELIFTDTQGNLTLNVDNDGDDIIDVTFQPSAVLDAISSLDITPPDITVVSIPSEILLNTDFTFTFSATDDLSGVEILKATLDDTQINSGDTVTLSQVGDHLFRVEATDKAGNPRVEEVRFKVVYDFGGFLSPLQKKTLVFQAGRSIPVKFQLRDVNNSVVSNVSASLFFAFLTNGEPGTFQLAVPKGKANIENQFRFDQEEQQYIYNWDTKPLTPGDYRLRVNLDDGTSKFIDVELRSNKQTAALIFLLDEISDALSSLLELLR